MDLPRCKVFVDEHIGGCSFFGGERIDLAYFWYEDFLHVDFVVVGSGWGKGPSGRFVKYFGESRVLGG